MQRTLYVLLGQKCASHTSRVNKFQSTAFVSRTNLRIQDSKKQLRHSPFFLTGAGTLIHFMLAEQHFPSDALAAQVICLILSM
ncbi:hypothetical protein D7Y05_02325 [bacterium 1XD42-54]|nr:hypothetical protein D7Y05_02325 [bacterium 1XD42-54]